MDCRSFVVAAIVAVGWTVAGGASAATFTTTYAGRVTSGLDTTDVFGLGPGSDLGGQTFTAVFTVDDTPPNSTSLTAYTGLVAGNSEGHPAVTATITINGVTLSLPFPDPGNELSYFGTHIQHVYQPGTSDPDYFNQEVGQSGSNIDGGRYSLQSNLYMRGYGSVAGPHFMTNPDWTAFGSDFTAADVTLRQGYLEFIHVDKVLKQPLASVRAHFVWDRINDTAAAPEPSTWAMMLMGFGALGALLRRARHKSLAN